MTHNTDKWYRKKFSITNWFGWIYTNWLNINDNYGILIMVSPISHIIIWLNLLERSVIRKIRIYHLCTLSPNSRAQRHEKALSLHTIILVHKGRLYKWGHLSIVAKGGIVSIDRWQNEQSTSTGSYNYTQSISPIEWWDNRCRPIMIFTGIDSTSIVWCNTLRLHCTRYSCGIEIRAHFMKISISLYNLSTLYLS